MLIMYYHHLARHLVGCHVTWTACAVVAICLLGFHPAGVRAADRPEERALILASTTSTENSGFLSYLLPIFQAETGIKVHVVAVGTGRALQLGEDGDVDVLLVHHPHSEQRFIAEEHGIHRRNIMYNDYVIVGPKADPLGLGQATSIADAMRRIAQGGGVFLSRGDDSGTHRKELSLWEQAGINLEDQTQNWRRETGAGMGSTLNTASALGAHTLSDRATWAAFNNRGTMDVLYAGDPSLRNPYGAILVNPQRHPHVLKDHGLAFINWLVSPSGQKAIAAFRPRNQQLFFPNIMTQNTQDTGNDKHAAPVGASASNSRDTVKP